MLQHAVRYLLRQKDNDTIADEVQFFDPMAVDVFYKLLCVF